MRRPVVLWLNEYPTLNGGERSFLAAVPVLRDLGFDVIAAAPPVGELADTIRQLRLPIEPFDCRGSSGVRKSLAELRGLLRVLLQRAQPDLLHANSLSMGRISGPVTAELSLPSISHLRDIIGLSAQAVTDLNCHRRLLAVSRATRDFHVAQGIDSARVHVVYNGVDLEQFAPRTVSGWLHQELGIPGDCELIGTIGQIILRKGHDVLARAAAELRSVLPHPHYLIIGSRHSQKDETVEFERELHRRFENAGLADRVHFLGVRKDVDRLLPELAALVHPARQEPLGRVLLEAAASGIAIVATDVGGTREIFPPSAEAAVIIPPDNPTALASAIHCVIIDKSLRDRLGANARRRAEQAFDASISAKLLAEQYRLVLDGE